MSVLLKLLLKYYALEKRMSRVPCSLRSLFTFAIVKENIMEKRIKIVWILTIITSLLMMGGQAYWLYNQYGYSAEAYMQKLHEQILEAEDKEADIRFQHRLQAQYMHLQVVSTSLANIQTTMVVSYSRVQ